MRQLTAQERESLMADMRSFFEQTPLEETFNEDLTEDDGNSNLEPGWSGDMP